jgi:hypothetical protein
MIMRGDNDGAAETNPTVRGVLVLTGNLEESARIREFARDRGLHAVELELPCEGDAERPRIEAENLPWRAAGVLRRARYESGIRPSPWLSCGPLSVESGDGEISLDGERLTLRKTERDVLTYLMQNAHRFVTPLELQEQVLKTHGNGGAARNQVYELRRKLRAAGHAEAIETRPHQGYRLRWTG